MNLTANQQEVLGYVLGEKRPVEYSEIQAGTGMGLSTVSRAVKSLERMGQVSIDTFPSPSGRGRRIRVTATLYRQEALIPEPDADWAESVSATARDVYAAILELHPHATFTEITDYLNLGRSVVNKACAQLEARHAIIVDTVIENGHRSMIASPNLGAEDSYRTYTQERVRPDWAEGLRDSAIEAYRFIYKCGPSTVGDLLRSVRWPHCKSTTVDALRALVEVGAVTYELIPRREGVGGPIRQYVATKGPYKASDKTDKTMGVKREGPAFGKVWAPPTVGRPRYRKLGRG